MGMQQGWNDAFGGIAQGCKGLILTGWSRRLQEQHQSGLQLQGEGAANSLSDHFGLFLSHQQLFTLRDESKGQADLWTLCLPDTSVMILHNVPIISKGKGIIPQPVSDYNITGLC